MNSTAELTRPAPKAAAQKRDFKVTYCPGPEDRAQTVWNGVTFQAGKPVLLSLDNKRHYIENDLPKQKEMADGTYVTLTAKTKVSMIELAKFNCCFEVEGFPRFIKPLPEGRRPQTSEEYRSWAQGWFASAGTDGDDIQAPREMLERWDDEAAMRERCGIGEDDELFLKPFFDMKVAQLKKHMAVKHAQNDGGDI